MSVVTDDPLESKLLETIVPSRVRIPDDPAPGNYVVIDVAQFSTTVPELLANGAEYVYITEERGKEPAFKEEHPRAKIGGGSGPNYEGEAGYDFFNSPSFVQDVDVAGRPTAMTSTNGGNAVTDLRLAGGDDVEIYVGGLTNGKAVADHLRDSDRETYFVAAGSNGKPSPEDTVGALYIARHLHGVPPTEEQRETYREVVQFGKGPKYEEKPQVKRTDLYEYTLAFDSREIVPKLEGQRLVDAAASAAQRDERPS
ncbi:2-phosphosulfolactate phosphatase [Natrinema longum]|uniref:2-phosphosulfolactate phosphatase n=1 Tax=Natrinema longum TaxID=370324 RepID=A0A8A2UE52_9EURY|nr:2-phosphosulfolactate phosphatase [Natrinema longum]MBZ6495164.1 2-phosphosulfolactate phosphatase [Natrinema longum]QSW86854.1 2-phosphosulfolactate phosphatase [Natrinema longum]